MNVNKPVLVEWQNSRVAHFIRSRRKFFEAGGSSASWFTIVCLDIPFILVAYVFYEYISQSILTWLLIALLFVSFVSAHILITAALEKE